VRREGREREERDCLRDMSNGRVDFQSLGQLLGSNRADLILIQPDWLSEVGREGEREVRREGREERDCLQDMSNGRVDFQSLGQLLGSSIPDIILLQPDWLSEVEREGEREVRREGREERDCLPDTSDGRVDFESLGQLLGSSIPDIIPMQPDWLSEVGREGGREVRREGRERGEGLLTRYE
jgi:hypothetical protein